MTERIKFTKKALRELALPPAGKRGRVFDTDEPGLMLDITPAGRKTFFLRRKVKGENILEKLGVFDEVSIEQARDKAKSLKGMISDGGNPRDKRVAERAELTLEQLFREYIERHAKKSRKTWAVMEKDFERNCSTLARKKLSNISPSDAERLHGTLGKEKGEYTANRTVQLLRAVYNKGKLWKLYQGDNPFEGITLFEEKPRERFLTEEEAATLLAALETNASEDLRDFIKLSLFTGVRKSNLMAARWQDIDWTAGTLSIPDTKNGTSQLIELGIYELTLLRERRERVSGEFVFPGPGKTGHLVDIKRAWTSFRERAGIKDCTIHDLRRSLAAGMASANVNVAIIKSAMHHKDMKTTLAVYAKTHGRAVKDARELVQSQWLKEAGLEPNKDNVHPLKRTGA